MEDIPLYGEAAWKVQEKNRVNLPDIIIHLIAVKSLMPRDNVSQTDFYLFFWEGGLVSKYFSHKSGVDGAKKCAKVVRLHSILWMFEHSETVRTEIVQSFLIMIAVSFKGI